MGLQMLRQLIKTVWRYMQVFNGRGMPSVYLSKSQGIPHSASRNAPVWRSQRDS